jgi:hypothetical protein
MDDDGTQDTPPAPGFVLPGIRTAVEMALAGIIVGLLGLPTQNPIVLSVVLLGALIAMVTVLFWGLNRHTQRWIRYAQGKPTNLGMFD